MPAFAPDKTITKSPFSSPKHLLQSSSANSHSARSRRRTQTLLNLSCVVDPTAIQFKLKTNHVADSANETNTAMAENEPAATAASEELVTSSTPEPGEKALKEAAGSSTPSSSVKNSPGVEAAATARRTGAGATGAASRSAAAPGSRTPGGTSKPSTRVSPSTARRSVTSTSISSHQSHPSMSASEDEKRSGAKTTMASAARKTSSVRSSPASTADKKPGAISTTATARRPVSGTGTAASPRASAAPTRPGTATTSSAGARPTAARSGATASSSTPEARKRLSAVGAATSTTRPSTRNSVRSEASLDALKMVEDLTLKIAEKDGEIETLRSQISQHEQVIADLREQADRAGTNEAADQESQHQYEEALAKLQAEHQTAIVSLDSQISEAASKQQALENDLAEAIRARDAAQIALETLETSSAENEAKLQANEETLQKALDDHAAQMDELKAVMIYQKEHEQVLAELASTHESAVAELKVQIEQMIALNTAMEASGRDAIDSERAHHASATAALETQVSELRIKLEASEMTVEQNTADSQSGQTLISKMQDDLKEKEAELASAREVMASTQNSINDLQSQLAAREDEMSKLKEMHDERMRQISQDYEKEIESLRGDAFFKRKYEELEKQHGDLEKKHASLEEDRTCLEKERNELKDSAAECADHHSQAIAALGEEHSVAVSLLETKISDVEQTLQAVQANHAEEVQTLKTTASAAEEAHAKELHSLKSSHEKALQLASTDGEASHARQLEDLKESHHNDLVGLRNSQEQVLQELQGSHQHTVDGLESSHQRAIEDLRASHELAFGGLQSQFCQEKEALVLEHEGKVAAIKEASATSLAAERNHFQAQLDKAAAELNNVRSSNLADLDAARHELIESHVSEVERMLAQHTETMEFWEAERTNAKKDLEELTAAHTKAIEDVVAEYRNNTSSYEEKISLQEAVNAKLQLSLVQAQDNLDKVQAESEDLSRQLAQEKMERMTILAEFDAVKTVKPDTSAIDSLKSSLIATTKAYEETLASVRMSLQRKQEELDVSKTSYRHLEERFTLLNQDLEFVKKSLDAFKADAQVKQGIAEADYNDLNESMTVLVEEANSRVKGLESRVEDLTMQVEIGQRAEEELLRRNEEFRKREEELLAQLKVRNAELAEEKARAAADLKGLANSRFAGCNDFGDHAAAIGLVAEGEDDDDHSSAALALLSKVRLTTKQIDALDREMRDRNLQLLNSITDVNLSG